MKSQTKITLKLFFLVAMMFEVHMLSQPASALTCQQLCQSEYSHCIDRCINFGLGITDCNTYYGCTDNYNMCLAGC